MVPYIPVRAKIFHMLPDLVENLCSLIASQYTQRQTAPSVDVEISFFVSVITQKHRLSVAVWKALSELQRQRVRHAVFSLAREDVAGTQQSTSTDGSLLSCTVQMLGRNWQVVVDQGPTAQRHKTRSRNFD